MTVFASTLCFSVVQVRAGNLVKFSCLIVAAFSSLAFGGDLSEFKAGDRAFLGSLSLSQLNLPKRAAGNEVVENEAAAEFGKALFFDTDLSSNRQVACASCHQPARYFTDGRPVSVGVEVTKRNAPSVIFAAYSPWQFWDGRKDSVWSQALGPLTSPEEHNVTPPSAAALVKAKYADRYNSVFSQSLDTATVEEVFVNIGKVIMAYQYKISVKPSRFDNFVDALAAGKDEVAARIFSATEIEGLKLFVGKGNCISCHNGPLLTNFEFHNVGVPEVNKEKVDLGRYSGVKQLAEDHYTCLSDFSAEKKDNCLEMKYLKTEGPELVGAFKTPSLRNVAMTAPYMHAGQFQTLKEVVEHYNKPKPPFYDRNQHPNRPHFDILPLRLSDEEKNALVEFLGTLTSPIPENDQWWGVSTVATHF